MKRELREKLEAAIDKMKKDNPSIAEEISDVLIYAVDVFLDEKNNLHGHDGFTTAISTVAEVTDNIKAGLITVSREKAVEKILDFKAGLAAKVQGFCDNILPKKK